MSKLVMQLSNYAEDCEASNSSSGEDSQASDSVVLSPRKLHNKWLDVSRSKSKIQSNLAKNKSKRTVKYLSQSISSGEVDTEYTDRSPTRINLNRYGADDLQMCEVDHRCRNKNKSRMYSQRKSGKSVTKSSGSRENSGAAGEGMILFQSQESSEAKRAFPFCQTPSGNLKVEPKQVIFESKKVSVLVADPKHTKVNIKAETDNAVKESMKGGVIPVQYRLKLKAGITGEDPKSFLLPPSENLRPSSPSNYGDDYEPSRLHKEFTLKKISSSELPSVDWNKTLLPFKTELFTRLLHRITNYINPDIEILISNEVFSCHLLVLQCYSDYFDQTKQASKVRLPEATITSRSFLIIYKWMIYPGSDSFRLLSRDNILEVFIASQYLSIKELEEQCWTFINSDSIFSEETAFLLYMKAKELNNSTITQLMIPRIMRFFLKLVGTTNFVELDFEDVSVIMRSNYIAVHNEIEVFMSAVRWLTHDWMKRKENLTNLMKCVRFGWIAPWQLVDIRRNPENPEFMKVTSHPDVQQLIEDGLSYAIIKYWYGNQTQDYYHWIDILGLQEPTQRNWIDEEKNYVTYREFLNDLELYQQPEAIDAMQLRSQQPNINTENFPPPPTVAEFMAQRSQKSESDIDIRIDIECGSILEPLTPDHNELKETPKRDFKHLPPFLHKKDDKVEGEKNMANQKIHHIEMYERIKDQNKEHTKNINNTSSLKIGCVTSSKSDPLLQSTGRDNFREIQDRENQISAENLCFQEDSSDKKEIAPEKSNVSSGNELYHHEERSVINRSPDAKYDSYKPKTDDIMRKLKNVSQLREHMNNINDTFPANKYYNAEGSLFYPNEESVLVFGGIDPHNVYGVGRNTGKDIYRYRPHINSWELIGELPEPRHHHSVVILRGKIFLVGGADPRDDDSTGKSIIVGSVWSFDPVSRNWEIEAEMLIPRKNFGLVVSNGMMYAIGGQDKYGRVLSSVECYDSLSGKWREVASLSVGRMGVAATKFHDYIWVAGGMTSSKSSSLNDNVECYDTRRNMWFSLGVLRFPRCFGNLFPMNDTLYLIGGAGHASQSREAGKRRAATSLGSIDAWIEHSREWVSKHEMAIPRHGHSSAYLGTQILIIGGVTTMYMRALSNVECFCCIRGTWIHGVANLPTPLSGHGCITLPPSSLM